jgi:hypothetical protein
VKSRKQKRQQAAAAYQAYRQGEWADPQPQKSLWQKAGDAIHGVISSLPSIVDGVNAMREIIYYVRDWYIATASHGWDWLGR